VSGKLLVHAADINIKAILLIIIIISGCKAHCCSLTAFSFFWSDTHEEDEVGEICGTNGGEEERV
jgi:hypothetical protein